MANPDHKIWLDVLSYLRSHHPDMCRQWFEEIEPLGANEGVFRARVGNPVHLRYLSRQCTDRFTEALQSVTGRLLTLRFIGEGEEAPAPVVRTTGQTHAAVASPGFVSSVSGGVGGSGASWSNPGTLSGPSVGSGMSSTHGGGYPVGNGVTAGYPAAGPTIEPKPGPIRSGATPAAAPPRHDSIVLVPDYTFENFIIGPENRLAHAAAVAVSANPGRAYNPLFIHGGVGLGKTHLLQAMCLRLMADRPGITIHYTSCDGFMNHFMDAVQAGQMSDFRHRFRDVDVLVIDDIHFLTKRDRTQEEFFHTFNTLYQNNKQIVLSSDAAPADIPDLEQRLVSRFQCGLVVQVNPPCYDTRVQIVKQKARIREIELPDDAACFIAGRTFANIRELEGSIVRVQMQALADKVPITLDLARAALGPGGDGSSRPEITITGIIDSVVEHYGVKLSDLQSKRRQKSIAHPRQLCMYLARRHTRYSLEEIGGYFGGRDHTTVMHAVRTIEERRNADSELGRLIASLETRLGAPTRS